MIAWLVDWLRYATVLFFTIPPFDAAGLTTATLSASENPATTMFTSPNAEKLWKNDGKT